MIQDREIGKIGVGFSMYACVCVKVFKMNEVRGRGIDRRQNGRNVKEVNLISYLRVDVTVGRSLKDDI